MDELNSKIFLSKNLRYLRKEKKLSQQQFADQLGIPRSRIAAYESKKVEPRLATLIAFANYFEVRVGDLIQTDLRNREILLGETSNPSGKEALMKKCIDLERLIHTRKERLLYLWEMQVQSNPDIKIAIEELQGLHILYDQALLLCKRALNDPPD